MLIQLDLSSGSAYIMVKPVKPLYNEEALVVLTY